MKVCMFHLMPYRELPADFEQRYNLAYIEPIWFDIANSDKVGQFLQCDARRDAICGEGRHAQALHQSAPPERQPDLSVTEWEHSVELTSPFGT